MFTSLQSFWTEARGPEGSGAFREHLVPLEVLPATPVRGGRGTRGRCRGDHYGEAEAAWIPRALKNEGHLLRGEAESSEFILVHFIPESPFSGAPSYRNCTNAQLVLWEGNTQTLEDKNHSQEEQRKPRGAKLLSQDHTEAEWMGRNTGAWLTSFKPIMFTTGLCPSYGSHNDDAHSLSGFGASRTCK